MWNDNDLKLRLERLGYQSIQIERSDHGLDDDSETQVSGRRHVDEHWVHYQETVRYRTVSW